MRDLLSPSIPPQMEDEITAHGCSLSQGQIILFVMLVYNCRLDIFILSFLKGNVKKQGQSCLVVRLWSVWEVLTGCSSTPAEPLLHSSGRGSADEGWKLTRHPAVKSLLTLFVAMLMTWLPPLFGVISSCCSEVSSSIDAQDRGVYMEKYSLLWALTLSNSSTEHT